MLKKEKAAKVSVIIPVYNVEEYLSRCIESVLRQTYQNLEIILVDDGSPDRCGEICDRYAETDRRITVYHKPNGGLSDARNYGTARATGDYIAYIDSDDYVSEDYISYLTDLLERYDADISVCGRVLVKSSDADFSTTSRPENELLLSGKEACLEICGKHGVTFISACTKIYKREIIAQYSYPVGYKHEDEATTPRYFYAAKRVAVGNRCLYANCYNPNSITHSQGEAKNTDQIWAFAYAALFFEKKNEASLAKKFWERYFMLCLHDSMEYDDRCYEDIKAYFKPERLSKRMRKHVPLYLASPKLYWMLKKVHSRLFLALHSRGNGDTSTKKYEQ